MSMPKELVPFMKHYYSLGRTWEQEVNGAIQERIYEINGRSSYIDWLISDLGYKWEVGRGCYRQGWPTKPDFENWEWGSIEELILLLKELDMGD